MKYSGVAAAAAAIVLASAGVCPAGVPEVGDAAPEVTVSDWLNTRPLTLASLRGKVVIVEFWATWCPPCRASIPHLIKLHNDYGKKGVVLMSLTSEPLGRIRDFVKQYGMTYAIGAGSATSKAYGVRGIPHAYIVDPDGKVAWHGHPMSGLDKNLQRVLRETPPITISPAELARVRKAIDLASRAIVANDYAQALRQLAGVRGMELPRELKQQAGGLLEAIDIAARARLARAKELEDAGSRVEAHSVYEAVERDFAGTDAARSAGARRAGLAEDPEFALVLREAQAARTLADAEADFAAKRYRQAKAKFGKVVSSYAGTPQAERAAARLKEIASKLAAGQDKRNVKSWLSMARNYARAGQHEKAKAYYKKILENYPDSSAAAVAREELGRLP